MPAISIVTVGEDVDLMQALSVVLTGKSDFVVVANVVGRAAAVKQVADKPSIMILDPAVLNEYSLSRFIRSVHLKSPQTQVIFYLTKPLPDENLIADIRAGARGHIKNSDLPETIIKALYVVSEGKIWAERRILESAISRPLIPPEKLYARMPGLAPLTEREVEMLTMVVQGASNREIATKSSISERTVKTHLYRVYRKLNVNSRTKAIALLSSTQ